MTSLTQCLEDDHRRLDQILIAATRLAAEGAFPRAHALFERFAAGLLRHIDAEERVLFPALEACAPGAEGPMRVMEVEHEQLRDCVQAIATHLANGDAAWGSRVRELKAVLLDHNAKEERILYPMSDISTRGRPDRQDVRAALEATIAIPAAEQPSP